MNCEMLIEELKKKLKSKGKTYKDLALALRMSEAAVKRMFAQKNFSLKRLDEICSSIGIDVSDLVDAVHRERDDIKYFSRETEEELAREPKLLLVLYCVLMGFPSRKICRLANTDDKGLFRIARQLEKLGLVEVHTKEKLRPRIDKSTRWLKDGPLVARYGIKIRDQFFRSTFEGEFEHQDFLTGPLTKESLGILKRKMIETLNQFDQLSALDARAKDLDSEVYWFYLGVRPWDPIGVLA